MASINGSTAPSAAAPTESPAEAGPSTASTAAAPQDGVDDAAKEQAAIDDVVFSFAFQQAIEADSLIQELLTDSK